MPQEKAGRSDRPKNSGPLTQILTNSDQLHVSSCRGGFQRTGSSKPAMHQSSLLYQRPKEWLEIEKVRPIGFIGKDILALEKKITEPSEIIKQNQGFEIPRLLNQQREQEQHPGIDR